MSRHRIKKGSGDHVHGKIRGGGAERSADDSHQLEGQIWRGTD